MLPVVALFLFLFFFCLGYVFFGGVDFSRPEKYSFVYEYQSLIAGGMALFAATLAFFVPLIVREIRKADFLSVFRHECFVYYVSIGTRANHLEQREVCGPLDFHRLEDINFGFIRAVDPTYLTKSERLTFALMKDAALRAENIIARWSDKVAENKIEEKRLLFIVEEVLFELLLSAKHAVSLCDADRMDYASQYPLINKAHQLIEEGQRLPICRAKKHIHA